MRPIVTNAGSERQVKEAEQKERLSLDQNKIDLGAMLSTKPGRRVVWRILEKCKVFETIWENSARIHYNAGQQDLGHWLMGEVAEAGEDYLFLMMKENKRENL